ncbi:selenium cofactor biosynthesis protein YqeC [Oscillospiraceae bacterium 38-13]
MKLPALLGLRPGVTAVIGSGGKTTLLRTLGDSLAGDGARVLLCTTTKIFPFPGLLNLENPTEAELAEALEGRRPVCAGAPVPGTGKLAAPTLPMDRLTALADYVLVEADGAAGHPLKAHAAYEPVIPPQANQVILMVGASGFGRPVREAVHRPEEYWFLTDLEPGDPVTPEAAAEALCTEVSAAWPPIRVFVNQVEDEAALNAARRLAECLPWPVYAGALKRRSWICLS